MQSESSAIGGLLGEMNAAIRSLFRRLGHPACFRNSHPPPEAPPPALPAGLPWSSRQIGQYWESQEIRGSMSRASRKSQGAVFCFISRKSCYGEAESGPEDHRAMLLPICYYAAIYFEDLTVIAVRWLSSRYKSDAIVRRSNTVRLYTPYLIHSGAMTQ